MSDLNHQFERAMLKDVMPMVKKVFSPETIKNAEVWAVRIGKKIHEFRLQPCEQFPEGLYLCVGNGCETKWGARAVGWQMALNRVEEGNKSRT